VKLVVLDTNVLVSALLVPVGAPALILRQFRDGDWNMAVSGTILEEYGRVLRRPRFGLNIDEIRSVLSEIESRSLLVIPSQRFNAVPEDPSDNEFLDVAVEAGADTVVSGDNHLLKLRWFHRIPIYSPLQFLNEF